MTAAERAYSTYESIVNKSYNKVTTAQLNTLYNILCRARRDAEYAKELEAVGKNGRTLVSLIESYFDGYNNLYGLKIQDTLTEYLDPSFADGGYFVISTRNGTTDEPISPIDLSVGDTAIVTAEYFSHATDMPLAVPTLHYTVRCDDGRTLEGRCAEDSKIEFEISLANAGAAVFRVYAKDENDIVILGSETAHGGLLFSRFDIRPSHPVPKDMTEFWQCEIDRLMRTDPTDESPDGYVGRVVSEFDMPTKNAFSIKRVDTAYLAKMRENKLFAPDDAQLEVFDLYELYVKAPGPCHGSAYLSLPKHSEGALPLRITYDGYGSHSPAPILSEKYISVHCSHHGYELAKPDDGYYSVLNAGILKYYGRAKGMPNSDYADPHDCYLLYLLLRNLQVIRFLTDPALSGFIEKLHEYWSGEIILTGGSMGGYQTVTVGGLLTVLGERSAPFKLISLEPSIPAFGDLAATSDPGKIHTGRNGYEENSDYFDAALIATMIKAPIRVLRVGLGDEACISSTIQAMLNSISDEVPKEVSYLQNSSHGYLPKEEKQFWYRYKNNAKIAEETENA